MPSCPSSLARCDRRRPTSRLAAQVFERVASAEGDAKTLFSTEALAGYGGVVRREVRPDEVQSVLND
jgi:hypothetical protein